MLCYNAFLIFLDQTLFWSWFLFSDFDTTDKKLVKSKSADPDKKKFACGNKSTCRWLELISQRQGTPPKQWTPRQMWRPGTKQAFWVFPWRESFPIFSLHLSPQTWRTYFKTDSSFFVLQSHQSLKTKHLQSACCIASQLEFVCGDLENQLKRGDFFPSSRDFRNLRFSIQSTVTDIFCRVLPFLHAFSCPDEYDCWYERNILDMTIVTS